MHRVSKEVVVRTHAGGDAGTIEITAYTSGDGSARMETRLVSSVEPTELIVRAAAATAGVGIQIEPGRVLLSCPVVS